MVWYFSLNKTLLFEFLYFLTKINARLCEEIVHLKIISF